VVRSLVGGGYVHALDMTHSYYMIEREKESERERKREREREKERERKKERKPVLSES